jgi:hypothetical protein
MTIQYSQNPEVYRTIKNPLYWIELLNKKQTTSLIITEQPQKINLNNLRKNTISNVRNYE